MRLIKTTAAYGRYSATGKSTTIESDGITVKQDSSWDHAHILSDTPLKNRKGKYLFEVTVNSITVPSNYSTTGFSIGLANNKIKPLITIFEEWGQNINFYNGFIDRSMAQIPYNFSIKDGDVVGNGWDLSTKKVEIFINGSSVFTYDTSSIFSSIDYSSTSQFPNIYPVMYFYPEYVSTADCKVNFGQQPHVYNYNGYIDPYYEINNQSLNILKLF